MNAYLYAVLSLVYVSRAAIAIPAFCHDNYGDERVIEIVCSGKSLDDDNYMDALNASLYHVAEAVKANTSMADRDVSCYVENNRITTLRTLPATFKITSLSFKNNRLVSGEDATFQHLPHLKNLDLGSNHFTGENLTKNFFRGSSYESLPLEYLSLANNLINKLRSDVFAHLANLISLDLGNNALRNITPETASAISRLPKLKLLSLAQTKLSHVPDTFFKKLSLQKLYLNGNHFTTVPAALHQQGSSLEYLNLNDNSLEEIDHLSFYGLTNLKELQLNALDTLTAIGEYAFTPLTSLTILSCTRNPSLEFIHPKAFYTTEGWTLRELYLDRNSLTSLEKDTIYIDGLHVWSMTDNPWNCTCSLKWLFQYVKKRQAVDPESNFGMKCRHPENLARHTMIFADKMLRCRNAEEKSNSSDSTDSFSSIYKLSLCAIGGILTFGVIFITIKMYRKMRHERMLCSFSTTAKYRRAKLNDNFELCNDENSEPS